MTTTKFDPLEFVLKNGVPSEDWFEKSNLPEITSLIEKIKSTAEDVKSSKCENDKVILKLLQTTVAIAQGLLDHTHAKNNDPLSPNSSHTEREDNNDQEDNNNEECREDLENNVNQELEKSQSSSPRSVKEEGYGSEEKSENTPSSLTSSTFSRFSRGSGRLSMLNNNIDVWIDAADRQLNKLNLSEKEFESKVNEEEISEECGDVSSSQKDKENIDQKSVLYKFKLSDLKSLGMSIIPFPDKSPMKGIEIQDILKDGMIDQDGRLAVKDQIIEINGRILSNVDFEQAQQIFKQALKGPEMILRVIKNQPILSPNQSPLNSSLNLPPPTLPKPLIKKKSLDAGMVEAEERSNNHQTKIATVTPTKKLSSTFGNVNNNKSFSLSHSFGSGRKIGKKFYIKLTKGSEGLGFSITTRDNPAGDNCPIYIKNILPEGSAIQDGRLKIGDRLLEVNGIEMSGKSHTEAVAILRNIPLGSVVDLVISRLEIDICPSPQLPRQLPSSETSSDITSVEKVELLTFEIPLNDTGSAGLGISVKGRVSKASSQEHTDLGIFVKNVMNGGAASKDGRLKKDDRLLSINGISLIGLTNSEAMEKLKRVLVSGEGPEAISNAITLTVARPIVYNKKLSHDSSFHSRNDSTISTDSTGEEQMFSNHQNKIKLDEDLNDTVNSSFSRSAENTVIFNPKDISNQSVNLEAHLNNPHPISDCLIGSTPVKCKLSSPSTPSSKSSHRHLHQQHSTPESYGLNKRNDIYIDDDSINLQPNLYTEPKYVTNERTYESTLKPVESDLSINTVDDGSFQRDGFGRQSISEKRHASIDAKNTDTYQRNRKNKDTKPKERSREMNSNEHQACTPINRGEEKKSENGPVKPARGIKAKNTMLFSPHCCWNCQSPGSCPYHVVPQLVGQTIGPNLGLKKSSSLESLQTMMQELQKEQLDSRGGNPFTGPRPATLKVPRNRITNESFRAAVDRSYDVPSFSASGQIAMETVTEEENESGALLNSHRLRTEALDNRPSAISVTGTICTATTATSSQITTSDERDDLIRKKKDSSRKKGLIKTLFNFGSKKGRSNTNSSKSNKKDTQQEAERMRARRAAQLEQEKIQEHFRKFIEQQKSQQTVIQPSNQPSSLMHFHSDSTIVSSHPYHSTPATSQLGFANNFQPLYDSSTPEKIAQLRAHNSRSSERFTRYNRVAPENGYGLDIADSANTAQLVNGYGTNSRINPHYLYLNSNDPRYATMVKVNGRYVYNPPIRRAYSYRAPSSIKNQAVSDLPPSTANNYDISKEAIERPGSRIGIVDSNDKYSHYMNYREIQQHLEHYQQLKTPQKSLKITSGYKPYSSASVSSTGDKIDTLPNLRHTSGMATTSSATKEARRAQRPLSNYEYDSAIQNYNLTNTSNTANQLCQANKLILSNNLSTNVKYGFMQRNVANHSSLPRHSVPITTMPNMRSKPAIYHQTSQVKIYGSNHQNGLNSKVNSNQANHLQSHINYQTYYGSLRYQRDQGSKI